MMRRGAKQFGGFIFFQQRRHHPRSFHSKMTLPSGNRLDVNLSGVFHCCKFGLEIMRDGAPS